MVDPCGGVVRVVVYPHSMEIGGSQLNAVELAGAVQALGHEVVVVGEQGPLNDTVERLPLELAPVPLERSRPSPTVVRTLVQLVGRRRIDVVHGYEWPPAVEAFLGPRTITSAAVVGTIMSASVAPSGILLHAPRGRDPSSRAIEPGPKAIDGSLVIEPPVDVESNSPLFAAGSFRGEYGLDAHSVLIVVVCRLVRELKLEGLLTACDAVTTLVTEGRNVQLAVVGDGDERHAVRRQADEANARAGRTVVATTGELDHPLPAYSAADIILGMGGSALRGMAFAKPLVVQGELGYWKTCTLESVDEFLIGGWYGRADGVQWCGAAGRSSAAPGQRHRSSKETGRFRSRPGGKSVQRTHAARRQLDIYEEAVEHRSESAASDLLRTSALLTKYKIRRKVARLVGSHAVDDFNSLQSMPRPTTTTEGRP